MADKTTNLGLILTPRNSATKTFIDYRMELSGDENSNMMIIDSEIAALKTLLENYNGGAITWGMLKNGFGAVQAVSEE